MPVVHCPITDIYDIDRASRRSSRRWSTCRLTPALRKTAPCFPGNGASRWKTRSLQAEPRSGPVPERSCGTYAGLGAGLGTSRGGEGHRARA
jgi:hypothetical protein